MNHISADLFGGGNFVHISVGGLDFNDAARGERDSAERSIHVGVIELVASEQPAIRQPRAAVPDMDEAADFGFESVAEGIEEIGQSAVAGSLLDDRARGMYGPQFAEISFEGVGHDRSQ
ncbi:MAG: hypothetical protein ABSA47_15960 [Verrucomicrobiota bacterium]